MRRGAGQWRRFVLLAKYDRFEEELGYHRDVRRIENAVRRKLPRKDALRAIRESGTPAKFIQRTFS